ncbi:MAG: radical SAM-associated putative lipoprotein [Rikenellaceae bacterium]|nr:radical SAM-associated putative lipoprotein [Rikenellaceae bacterium]
MKRFLYWLLTMLGFSSMVSCDGDINQHADMYGTPSADYEIKGKVLDADGDPIKGIKVEVQTYVVRPEPVTIQRKFSLDDGTYDASVQTFPVSKLRLVAQDVDGAENGGEFAERTIELDFSKVEATGDKGAWYSGKFSLEQDIVLEEKVSDEE